MIENLWDVGDFRVPLTVAKEELEILHPIKARIKAARGKRGFPADAKQMPGIHDRAEILG